METLKRQVAGKHYKEMAFQPMEFFLANSTPDEILGMLRLNVLKYLWRDKEDVLVQLNKAKHYLEIVIEHIEQRRSKGEWKDK